MYVPLFASSSQKVNHYNIDKMFCSPCGTKNILFTARLWDAVTSNLTSLHIRQKMFHFDVFVIFTKTTQVQKDRKPSKNIRVSEFNNQIYSI